MMSSAWERVTAPGLPNWPALRFDSENRQAIVSAAIPTWRSRIYAEGSAQVLIFTIWIAIGYWLWTRSVSRFSGVETLFVFAFFMALLFPLVAAFTKPNLVPLLVRRLFATKTKVMFSAEMICIKSRLYSQPIVVWRSWEGRPVRCRFMVEQDQGAARAGDESQILQQRFGGSLREATIVALLIDTGQTLQVTPEPGFDSSYRSVPVTEANTEFATKLTTVYTAAAALTSRWNSSLVGGVEPASQGLDIDLD